MWPLLAIGLGALLWKELFGEEEEEEYDDKPQRKVKRKKPRAVRRKKIFISFAMDDVRYRDFLVAQAKNERSPFSFTDMSVKEPWPEAVWKRRCRELIRGCDGVIVLLSKKIWRSKGARWEIRCAHEEGIPVIGLHIKKHDKTERLPELEGCKIIEWSWDNLEERIDLF